MESKSDETLILSLLKLKTQEDIQDNAEKYLTVFSELKEAELVSIAEILPIEQLKVWAEIFSFNEKADLFELFKLAIYFKQKEIDKTPEAKEKEVHFDLNGEIIEAYLKLFEKINKKDNFAVMLLEAENKNNTGVETRADSHHMSPISLEFMTCPYILITSDQTDAKGKKIVDCVIDKKDKLGNYRSPISNELLKDKDPAFEHQQELLEAVRAYFKALINSPDFCVELLKQNDTHKFLDPEGIDEEANHKGILDDGFYKALSNIDSQLLKPDEKKNISRMLSKIFDLAIAQSDWKGIEILWTRDFFSLNGSQYIQLKEKLKNIAANDKGSSQQKIAHCLKEFDNWKTHNEIVEENKKILDHWEIKKLLPKENSKDTESAWCHVTFDPLTLTFSAKDCNEFHENSPNSIIVSNLDNQKKLIEKGINLLRLKIHQMDSMFHSQEIYSYLYIKKDGIAKPINKELGVFFERQASRVELYTEKLRVLAKYAGFFYDNFPSEHRTLNFFERPSHEDMTLIEVNLAQQTTAINYYRDKIIDFSKNPDNLKKLLKTQIPSEIFVDEKGTSLLHYAFNQKSPDAALQKIYIEYFCSLKNGYNPNFWHTEQIFFKLAPECFTSESKAYLDKLLLNEFIPLYRQKYKQKFFTNPFSYMKVELEKFQKGEPSKIKSFTDVIAHAGNAKTRTAGILANNTMASLTQFFKRINSDTENIEENVTSISEFHLEKH